MQHHRGRRRSHVFRTILQIAGFGLVCGLVLTGIYVIGGQFEKRSENVQGGSLEGRFGAAVDTKIYDDREWRYRTRDLTNILVIGVDWDEDRTESVRYAGQADFLMLVTIDEQAEAIQPVLIDRDTMSPIRIYGPFGDYAGQRTAQLCLSYAYGDTAQANCGNAVWAVSQFLGGIPIDAYMVLDIESIAIINDAIGGVTVTIEDDMSRLDSKMTKGRTLRLEGRQAEYYLRGRQGIGSGTNAERMQRQRTYLSQAMSIFSRIAAADMNFVGELLDQLSGHLTTGSGRGWLINRAYDCADYEMRNVRTIAGEHSVSAEGFMQFWADEDALNDMLIRHYYE